MYRDASCLNMFLTTRLLDGGEDALSEMSIPER